MEKIDSNTNILEFITQTTAELPTGRVIHDEIGISWDVIAREVYFCSRNNVEKYAEFLPREFYTINQGEAASATLDVWDKVISKYQESIRGQDNRKAEVADRWRQERPKYERALEFSAQFLRLSKDELAYIREQTGDETYTPVYDREYDILDVAYDEIARKNKQILLERIELVLEELPIKQAKRLATFYNGYTALAYIPLVACISIMSEDAKQRLKQEIDNITANTQEQLQRAFNHSKSLVDCYGIRQGDSMKLRGGWQTVWDEFEKKTEKALYLHVLRLAALVLVFPLWSLDSDDLEMLMEYAFFLNDDKRWGIMEKAKEALAAGEIKPPHTIEKIKPLIVGQMNEEEALERYFELEIANQVYDM